MFKVKKVKTRRNNYLIRKRRAVRTAFIQSKETRELVADYFLSI
jgi:hypothetical protein